MAIDDYMDVVAPEAEAKAANQMKTWAQEQGRLFKADPFGYSQSRAKLMLAEQGVGEDAENYSELLLNANMRAQQSLSGRSDMPVMVMSKADEDNFKAMLNGRGPDGQVDRNLPAMAMQALEKFPTQELRMRAYNQLGLPHSIAPLIASMGPMKENLAMAALSASGKSVGEQTNSTASMLGTSSDDETYARKKIADQLLENKEFRGLFGPDIDDPSQRENVDRAVQTVVTALRSTGEDVDSFIEHLETNYETHHWTTNAFNRFDTPGDNAFVETWNTVVDIINPFGDSSWLQLGDYNGPDRERVAVSLPKGLQNMPDGYDYYSLGRDNDAWGEFVWKALDIRGEKEISILLDALSGNTKLVGDAATQVSPGAAKRWKENLDIERVIPRDGKYLVEYYSMDPEEPSIQGAALKRDMMSREQFIAFAKERSTERYEAMFKQGQLTNHGNQLVLTASINGRQLTYSVSPTIVQNAARKGWGDEFRAMEKAVVEPFQKAWKYMSEKSMDFWDEYGGDIEGSIRKRTLMSPSAAAVLLSIGMGLDYVHRPGKFEGPEDID